jgi:hypothetical protein
MLIAMTFLSAGFAKSVKISSDKLKSIKDIEKIIDVCGFDVIENIEQLYLGVSEDRKYDAFKN